VSEGGVPETGSLGYPGDVLHLALGNQDPICDFAGVRDLVTGERMLPDGLSPCKRCYKDEPTDRRPSAPTTTSNGPALLPSSNSRRIPGPVSSILTRRFRSCIVLCGICSRSARCSLYRSMRDRAGVSGSAETCQTNASCHCIPD
jgi:hypothetical protein